MSNFLRSPGPQDWESIAERSIYPSAAFSVRTGIRGESPTSQFAPVLVDDQRRKVDPETSKVMELEEEVYLTLTAQIYAKQKQLHMMKFKKEQKMLNELQRKERDLEKRLEQVEEVSVSEIKENEKEDTSMETRKHKQIYQLKKKIEGQNDAIDRLGGFEEQLKKEEYLERIAKKRMQLENLKYHQSELDKRLHIKEAQVNGIRDELDSRDLSKASILERALARAENIEKRLREKGNQEGSSGIKELLMRNQFLRNEDEAKLIKEEILNEAIGHLQNKVVAKHHQNIELTQKLNEQRIELIRKEQQLRKKKAVHQEMVRRGLEFLTEVQLGKAPPQEFLEKNILSSVKVRPGKGESLEQIVARSRKIVEETEGNLKKLRSDADATKELLEEEKKKEGGVYVQRKPVFYASKDEEIFIQGMMDYILDKAYLQIENYEEFRKDLGTQEEYLKSKQEQRTRVANFYAVRNALAGINKEMIFRIATDMIREVCREVYSLNEVAITRARAILVEPIHDYYRPKDELPYLGRVLAKLQDLQVRHRKTQFFDKIHHQLVPRPQAEKMQNLINRKGKDKKKGQDELLEDVQNQELFDDDEAVILDPFTECKDDIDDAEKKSAEVQFWNNFVEYRTQIFGGTIGTKPGGVVAMAMSGNGRFLSVSINNGVILVYEMRYRPPRLYRTFTYSPSGSFFTSLETSMDGYQLLGITNLGEAYVFGMRGNNSRPPKASQYILHKSKDKPGELDLIAHINYKNMLTQEEDYQGAQDNYFITYGNFHSQFTMSGLQNSVVLGCKNGIIIRWIINNLPGMNNWPSLCFYQPVQSPNCSIIPTEIPFVQNSAPFKGPVPKERKQPTTGYGDDATEMSDNESYLSIESAPKAAPKAKPPAKPKIPVNREFYYEHRFRIIHLDFINYGEEMLSIDARGHIYIWEYEMKHYNEYANTFKPNFKMRVQVDTTTYSRDDDNFKLLFPPEGAQLDPKNLSDNDQLICREYMADKHVNLKEIVERAIDSQRNKNEATFRYIVPSGSVSNVESGTRLKFHEYVFSRDQILIQHTLQDYKALKSPGQIEKAKMTKDKQYLIVQVIYPHVLGARGLTNLDYVVFRPYERKLNKIKISIKTKYRPNHDYPFEVTDNVEPFGVPYIYHLFDDNILMQSLLTGTVIRKFQYNLGSTKNFKKEVFADLLISTHHPKAYLASNKIDIVLEYTFFNQISEAEYGYVARFKDKFLQLWQ